MPIEGFFNVRSDDTVPKKIKSIVQMYFIQNFLILDVKSVFKMDFLLEILTITGGNIALYLFFYINSNNLAKYAQVFQRSANNKYH